MGYQRLKEEKKRCEYNSFMDFAFSGIITGVVISYVYIMPHNQIGIQLFLGGLSILDFVSGILEQKKANRLEEMIERFEKRNN